MGRSHIPRHRQRGQELVEFALILPLLLLLMVGIFEFGYVVFAYNTLSNAVREGARLGSVNPVEADILGRARNLTSGLDQGEIDGDIWTVTITEARVSVEVAYEHESMTGFIFGLGPITLRAASSMGIE
jgi:Flp pilus assembly protein TadG